MPGSRSSDRTDNVHASAEPLALTVHSVAPPQLGGDAVADESRTKNGRLKMLLVLAVCAAPVIASYFTYFVIRPQTRSNYGDLIVPTRSTPELALTTLDGKPVAVKTLRGQWLLVSVGPSSCDANCDKRLFMQRQFREMMGRERDRIDKIWFITDSTPLKPELRKAVEAAPAVTALRADPEVLAKWLVPAPGHALEEHLYLIDPMGEFMMRLPVQPDPGKTKRDLERLLRASASWDTPGR
jgi:cytochrome oxidase Cu insertion factor (SCO1/SenC/PrrC family)